MPEKIYKELNEGVEESGDVYEAGRLREEVESRLEEVQTTRGIDKLREEVESRLEEVPTTKEIDRLRKEIESKFEKVPTKEEILEVIGVTPENCVMVTEKSDENGLYLLEITVEGKEAGQTIGYDYRRKGEFDGGHKAGGFASLGWEGGSASIHRAVYDADGGFIEYPDHIHEYRADTGKWKKPEEWKDLDKILKKN